MKRFEIEEGVFAEVDVIQICVSSKTKSTNVISRHQVLHFYVCLIKDKE